MSGEVRLSSGQLARIYEGRVEVVPPSIHHYKLVAEHSTGGELTACCFGYDSLIDFLKQLELLDYRLSYVKRIAGEVPPL